MYGACDWRHERWGEAHLMRVGTTSFVPNGKEADWVYNGTNNTWDLSLPAAANQAHRVFSAEKRQTIQVLENVDYSGPSMPWLGTFTITRLFPPDGRWVCIDSGDYQTASRFRGHMMRRTKRMPNCNSRDGFLEAATCGQEELSKGGVVMVTRVSVTSIRSAPATASFRTDSLGKILGPYGYSSHFVCQWSGDTAVPLTRPGARWMRFPQPDPISSWRLNRTGNDRSWIVRRPWERTPYLLAGE